VIHFSALILSKEVIHSEIMILFVCLIHLPF